ALLLAAEGARVVVNDLGTTAEGGGTDVSVAQAVVDEIEAAGGKAVANGDDVASFDGARHLIDTAVETFGGLDILVNNAGFLRDAMSFNMDEEAFDAVIRVHLKGHFASAKFAAAHWRARAKAGEAVYGRIINTTSEAGLWGTVGQSNYASAKGGIVSMTLTLARELERLGVTVNAVAPRARTRMTEAVLGGLVASEGAFDDWHPDNVAPAVGWLASPAAAGISGQVFVVTGGNVHWVAGFSEAGSLRGAQRWTVEGLIQHQDHLFAGRPTGIPDFGIV
ncbi:MAG: SDR family NAD(P)-dependent oxidoreductase, partial [Acidimicrobiales bacterium]